MWPLSADTRPADVIPDVFCIVSRSPDALQRQTQTSVSHEEDEQPNAADSLSVRSCLLCLCWAKDGLLEEEASLCIVWDDRRTNRVVSDVLVWQTVASFHQIKPWGHDFIVHHILKKTRPYSSSGWVQIPNVHVGCLTECEEPLAVSSL